MARTQRHRRGAVQHIVAGALRGALSGVVGTAAMDLTQFRRYRSGGGAQALGLLRYEFGAVDGWEHAPAPAQAGRRAARALLGVDLADRAANAVNNVMHWSYGMAWAAAAGALAAATGRRSVKWGPLFGTAVWLSD